MSKNRPYKHVTVTHHARLVRRGFSRNQSREALKKHVRRHLEDPKPGMIQPFRYSIKNGPIQHVTKNHYVFDRDVDIILTTKQVEIDDGEEPIYLNHEEFIAWLNSVTSVYYSNHE